MSDEDNVPASHAETGIDRRQLLRWMGFTPVGLSVTLAPPAAQAARGGGGGSTTPTWAIGGNVDVRDWAPSPFVDIVKSSRGFHRPGGNDYGEDFTLALDAQGWPLEPSRIVVTTADERPGTEWASGIWKGRFRGTGALDVANSVGAITNVKKKGDTTTFDWTVNPADPTKPARLILTFTGPIRELRVVRPGFSIDNSPLLHPDALDYYKQFHTLRFLGFMGQNETEDEGEATWAQRQPAGKWHGRKSWEAMVEFFKAVYQASGSKTRGLWWNVPYRFGQADCLAMGQHLASLLPGAALKFPELSNELWNTGYAGKHAFFWTRAQDPADPDFARIDAGAAGDPWTRVGRLRTLATARMCVAMKQAFPGAFGTTLFPVMAGQYANIYWTRELGLAWLAEESQRALFGGLPNTFVGTLSCAPYLQGGDSDGVAEMDVAPDVASMLLGLRSSFAYSLAALPAYCAHWSALKTEHGIGRLDAYEWQLHLDRPANQEVKRLTTFSPGAGELVRDMARAMRVAGFNVMCFLMVSPIKSHIPDVNSYLWPLNESFGGPKTAKGLAVAELVVETGQ